MTEIECPHCHSTLGYYEANDQSRCSHCLAPQVKAVATKTETKSKAEAAPDPVRPSGSTRSAKQAAPRPVKGRGRVEN